MLSDLMGGYFACHLSTMTHTTRMRQITFAASALLMWRTGAARADELPALTTLSNPSIRYTVPDQPYVKLRRGPIELVVVDDHAVNDGVLPDHKAGYSGVAALHDQSQPRSPFVPLYAGLNHEFIHDGTRQSDAILFEPRRAPVELRIIDEHTVELYQAPTPHWKLESCTRYELLPDGTIEMTVEVIPRAPTFTKGYIGLFWASYIDQPESVDIHFRGPEGWVRGVSAQHGSNAVHRGINDQRDFPHEKALAERLKLLFGFSGHRYAEPWYFGVCRGMALAFLFREQDQIRFTQSPNGGGPGGNPAWDFQWYVEGQETGRRYQMVMRLAYRRFESNEQIRAEISPLCGAMERSTGVK